MKNYFYILLAVLFLGSSCNKDEPPFLFTMDYELEFNIQPGLNTFEIHGVEVENIQSRIQSYMTANNIALNEIIEIDPASARLTADFADTEYNFIRRVSVYIAETNNPSNNKLIFERLEVPQNTGNLLDLVPTLVDPTDFLKMETFDIWFEMELRNISPSLLDSRLRLQFKVLDK